ncbi:hypothetical protein ABKY54_004165 [Vibrio harveyi]
MTTLAKQTNKADTWKAYPSSSDFSGIVQNQCDAPVYLFVSTKGNVPTDASGIVLKAGIGEYLPVSISSAEELYFKPVNASPVTVRLG